MTRSDQPDRPPLMLTLASIAVVIAALYLGKGVLIPLTLAVLLSFLLSPLCDWLERRGLSRIPSVLATAALGFSLLGILVWIAVVQISSLTPKFPEYQQNIETRLHSVNEYAATTLSKVTKTAQGMGEQLASTSLESEGSATEDPIHSVRIVSSPASSMQVFSGMFGSLLEVVGTTGIVIVLVVFFLIRREDLRDRFIHLIGKGQVTVTTQMLEDAGARVSRYLSTLFLINLMFGVSVGVGLSLIGVPNAILLGIIAAVLRFVPYVGPWGAALLAIGFSLAISTGWIIPLLTLGLFVVLELFNNNILEPWLYGRNTGVSGVAVLVAAVFWMWLWGPIGLLLATPLTVCLLVLGKHIPQLSFLDVLLGTEPVFEPQDRVYQRLLAGDQEEVAELLEGYLKEQPLAEVYDRVFIPAMAIGEVHWQLGEINENRHEFIIQSLKELIDDQRDRQQERRAKEQTAKEQAAKEQAADLEITAGEQANEHSIRVDKIASPERSIVCLPARSKADEIAAMMLAQVLESKGFRVQTFSLTDLADEMLELVASCRAADMVCISAAPPAAVMHARYLTKRLRARIPQARLIVGLWDPQGDLDKARERIGCDAIVVATLADADRQINSTLDRPLPRQVPSGSTRSGLPTENVMVPTNP